jgi:beta-1,4-mannosyltransferase
MQYHAHALAAHGVEVDLVGFEGTPLPRAITDEPRIRVHRLTPSTLRHRSRRVGLAYAFVALVDAAVLSFRLWRSLRRLTRPDLVLVQNPPAFPTLVVTWFSLRRKGVRFVIDWHNLGFTLLRLRLGRWHPAVRLARWFERRDARRVDANLCVSRGLAAFLESRFGVKRRRPPIAPRRCSCRSSAPTASASARRCSRAWARAPAPSASSSARRAGPRTKTSTS